MAYKIVAPSGAVEGATSANGKTFTLAEMQAIVEGHIEVARVTNGLAMICNENGKLVNLPYNPTATLIYHEMGGNKWDCIVGNVLVGTWEELGFVDEEEEEEEET